MKSTSSLGLYLTAAVLASRLRFQQKLGGSCWAIYLLTEQPQRRTAAALSQSSLEATVQVQLLHPGQGVCQLPFSPTNTNAEQACPFQSTTPAAALNTTMPRFRHTTKRRSGRTGATSSWRGSVRMGLYHPYGCFTGHFYLTFCHHCKKRL